MKSRGMKVLWLTLATAILLIAYLSITPAGTYYDKAVDSGETPAYWVFEGGKVYLRSAGSPDIRGGTYFKRGNDWVMQPDSATGEVLLIPRLVGISMISTNDPALTKWLPRRGCSWLAKPFGR